MATPILHNMQIKFDENVTINVNACPRVPYETFFTHRLQKWDYLQVDPDLSWNATDNHFPVFLRHCYVNTTHYDRSYIEPFLADWKRPFSEEKNPIHEMHEYKV